MDGADLLAAGVPGLVANAFHLSTRPGFRALEALGGLHTFLNWSRPILCDSGGFQVLSMLAESPKLGGVTGKGIVLRREAGGERELFTPEKCVRWQVKAGADLVVCLDHCTRPTDPPAVQRDSVEHTVEWARRGRREFALATAGRADRPRLLAVVQGGDDLALRRECAERLAEIGFDAYGFGGWPIRDDGQLVETVHAVAEMVPPGAARWALGVGKPEHVVRAAGWGYGLFDCVLPTRDARHRRLYTFTGDPASVDLSGTGFYRMLYIQDETHARDRRPLDERCDCAACRGYGRAYLHHLFRVGDTLAERLATIHNLRFYSRLMERLRA